MELLEEMHENQEHIYHVLAIMCRSCDDHVNLGGSMGTVGGIP